MNTIMQVIMKRDNLSQDEAQDMFDDFISEVEDMTSLDEIEDALMSTFGLEPDYITEVLEYLP